MTRKQLAECAVWEFALSSGEIGDGDNDPSTILPRVDLSSVTTEFNGLVRVQFTAPDGTAWIGWVMPCAMEIADPGFHWMWRSQPEVFTARGRMPMNAPFLSKPGREDVAALLIKKIHTRLGREAARVFPLVVRPSVPISGMPAEWIFTGLVQPDGTMYKPSDSANV